MKKRKPSVNNEEYPLNYHIKDLRKRLVLSIIGILVSATVCLFFSDSMLHALKRPIKQGLGNEIEFVVLVPHEYFLAQLKISVFSGLFFSFPWVLYQIWLFISPGLYESEKKSSILFVVVGSALFALGIAFGYFFVLPFMFDFFISSLPADTKGSYSIIMLFDFILNFLTAFGVVFEAPVIVFILTFSGLIKIKTIEKARRHMIVVAFIIGAILTPPDPFTQIMMAIPLIMLFELGLVFSKIYIKKLEKNI